MGPSVPLAAGWRAATRSVTLSRPDRDMTFSAWGTSGGHLNAGALTCFDHRCEVRVRPPVHRPAAARWAIGAPSSSCGQTAAARPMCASPVGRRPGHSRRR